MALLKTSLTGESREAFRAIERTCPEEVIRRRLDMRMEPGDTPSDGRWELFDRQKEEFEEVTEVPKTHFLTWIPPGR